MSLILYINGQQADLTPGQVIAQTLQVNDLNSLQNRQASYTNKFSLPKTAHNIKLLDFLTLPGNNSNVPYQKNTCSLYSHSGECFVYNGWAVITDGGDSYECVVYDGIIDLYKAIENKTLADLGLGDLTHDKNPQAVAASWNDEASPYRYIIADYNGKMDALRSAGVLHVVMDYFVPSVSVAWLWRKIFDAFNGETQPTGSIFRSPDFTNLWMTFPKGILRGEEQDVEVLLRTDIAPQGTNFFGWNRYIVPIGPANSSNTDFVDSIIINDRHIKVKKPGRYRLEFSGEFSITKPVSVKIGRNSQNVAAVNISNTITMAYSHPGSGSFEYSHQMWLNANDTLCIILDKHDSAFGFNNSGNNLEVRLVHMEEFEVNFADAFSDFSIRDFLNEVVHRFGLTIFKDKYSNNYHFITPEELLETAPTVNWSRKFSDKVAEDYLTGSYAQRNMFTYTYNDKEATYNDGNIDVQNSSLPETKTLFKSKIYSPEQLTTAYPQTRLNVYKMWEKQPVEKEVEDAGGETQTVLSLEYKPLDKRYYFMYSKTNNSPHKAVSAWGDSQYSSKAYYESFSGLSFKDIMQNYYAPVTNLLSRALVVTAQMYLSENDVANFDFNKFYYIEQLGASFLVNKIINYVPGKPVTVELIRIRRGFYSQMPLYITAVEAEQDANGSQRLLVHFISQLDAGTNITIQYQTEDIWENPLSGTQSPLVFNIPAQLVGQTKRMRLWYQGGISNQVTAIWLGSYTIVV